MWPNSTDSKLSGHIAVAGTAVRTSDIWNISTVSRYNHNVNYPISRKMAKCFKRNMQHKCWDAEKDSEEKETKKFLTTLMTIGGAGSLSGGAGTMAGGKPGPGGGGPTLIGGRTPGIPTYTWYFMLTMTTHSTFYMPIKSCL